MSDQRSLDRAVALIRELESHRTEEPEVPRAWDRLIARGIDIGLAMALFGLLLYVSHVLWVLVWGTNNSDTDEFYQPSAEETAFLATFGVAWLIIVIWNEVVGFGRGRQTLGKRLMGIQVISSENGEPAQPARMFGRWLSLVLAVLVIALPWFLLVYRLPTGVGLLLSGGTLVVIFVLFLGRNGRGVHDRLWHTKLVRPR